MRKSFAQFLNFLVLASFVFVFTRARADVDPIISVTAVLIVDGAEQRTATILTRPGTAGIIEGSGLRYELTPSIEKTGIKVIAKITRTDSNTKTPANVDATFLVHNKATATLTETNKKTGTQFSLQVTPTIL